MEGFKGKRHLAGEADMEAQVEGETGLETNSRGEGIVGAGDPVLAWRGPALPAG